MIFQLRRNSSSVLLAELGVRWLSADSEPDAMTVKGKSEGSVLRSLAGILGVLCTVLVLGNVATLPRTGEYTLLGLIAVPFGILAFVLWQYALRGEIGSSTRSGCVGGLIVGSIGFLFGFIGPLVFRPEANQGPLLGILITGPLGMVAGFVGGLVVGIRRKRPSLQE